MQHPNNVVFATSGVVDDTPSLAQAALLARRPEVQLTALLVCPALPEAMREYKEAYTAGLRAQLQQRVETCAHSVGVDPRRIRLEVQVEAHPPPFERALRYAQENGCDLLVKQIEPTEEDRGFKALDLGLVRKSPCPLWLCRPSHPLKKGGKIAVAIDPESLEPEERQQSMDLLRVARLMADAAHGTLEILSCWDYVFEGYLKRNAWFHVPDNDLHGIVQAARSRHSAALNNLIEESGIGGARQVEHLRGQPETVLPEYVSRHGVDVLVMGGPVRSGLTGWVIGNTSEDIMRGLDCSILALKPSGRAASVAM